MARSSLNELLAPVLERAPMLTPENEVAVLRELPVETLYLALKEADAETSLWFYENARPEQVQGIIDIDCWEGDTWVPERYEEQFKNLVALSPMKIVEYMRELDPEVIVRGILEFAEVLDYDPQNPPELGESDYLLTLDNKYLLVLKKHDPNLKEALFQWLNKFSAGNIELLRRHLESAKWEVPSDLEEFGYRIKKGRLEEMGFVDYYDAIALYANGQAATLKKQLLDAPLDEGTKFPPELVAREDDTGLESTDLLPAPVGARVWSRGFIRDCLGKIDDNKRRQILLMEILRTVNASLAADKLLHGSFEEIETASGRARAYLELGLLYLADGDATRGAQLLLRQPVAEVFRLGWLTVHDLARGSRELKTRFGSALFSDADTRLIDSLTVGRHPELDHAQLADLGVSEFPSFDGVMKLGARLAELAAIAQYAWVELEAALHFKDGPEDGTLYQRLLALLVRQSFDGATSSKPFTTDEWKSSVARFDLARVEKGLALVGGRVPEKARPHFERRMREHLDELKGFMGNNPGAKIPDPRFFKALFFAKS